ncbi:hypothetical protein [Sporocytophaga myxococcoides]|uniref:hypothetical protein n=1 Tax=Sporocytophaga myxococcoides TaxID=153721 RepID=UPI00048FB82A|nr:hypothetical protein [Sporocytophaga myxococcoides]
MHYNRRAYLTATFIEWLLWIGGSVLLIFIIRWCISMYGGSTYEMHVWISATLYLWYVSTMSILVGSTYFVARAAQTDLERRQNHPQKPEGVNLDSDLARIKKIKKRSAIFAIIVHTLNAGFVYYISRHIPGITPEFRVYATLGVLAIAAIKPGFAAINSLRQEIFGMQEAADYPIKSVADLWIKVEAFGDYEERLKDTFKAIEEAQKNYNEMVTVKMTEIATSLETYKTKLHKDFEQELLLVKSSDTIREQAYNELKQAQVPITKEISKILNSIQSLKDFVIELRDKNIKGEQLMSALKEFGIDSLSDLNVTFQKSIVDKNPKL